MRTLLAAVLMSLLAWRVDAADFERALEFSIPSQALSSALMQFAEQSRIQVLTASEDLGAYKTEGVRGRVSVRKALEAILSGTGLIFREVGEGTVTIARQGQAGSNPPVGQDVNANSYIQLAQEESRQGGSPDANSEAMVLDEVVVTGTHIRGASNIAAPLKVIDREEIARSGLSTLEGVMESLPQNFAEIAPDTALFQQGGSLLASQNSDRASSANLRGLGAESTLTLLNGTRRANSSSGRVFDLSALPLLAIERIEVVTGGRSAVYGADAVAGVVNIITRRSFEGLQSEVSYGGAQHGSERLQLSQIGGLNSERGSLVAAYDYQREWPLNVVDTDAFAPSTLGDVAIRLDGQPDTRRHSAFLAGKFDISDRIEFHGDAQYTSKEVITEQRRILASFGATNPSFVADEVSSEVYSGAGGARIELTRKWSLDLSGSASVVDTDDRADGVTDLGFIRFPFETHRRKKAKVSAVNAVANGQLLSMGGITPRLAVGIEYRAEDFEEFDVLAGSTDFDGSRSVKSVFSEILLPVFSGDSRHLDVSLAGRYDDYSDFGDTFNPQIGVIWQPLAGLSIRGAFSTAFRTPALDDLRPLGSAFVQDYADPASGTGASPVLEIQGSNPQLRAEKADTWSIGFDYKPGIAPWASVSLAYFNVEYEGRINVPAVGVDDQLVLVRETNFSELVNRSPTSADIDAIRAQLTSPINNFSSAPWDPNDPDILAAIPNLVVFDNRLANIAIESASGLDLDLATRFISGIGELSFGVNATYTLDHEARLTATSPPVDRLNEVGKPVDFRVRASAGWTRGSLGGFLYVNYTDRYKDPFPTPAARMASWTTTDLTLRFDGAKLSGESLAHGFTAALSVSNLFDSNPPRLRSNDLSYGYDPTNANPIGRYVSLRLTRKW